MNQTKGVRPGTHTAEVRLEHCTLRLPVRATMAHTTIDAHPLITGRSQQKEPPMQSQPNQFVDRV